MFRSFSCRPVVLALVLVLLLPLFYPVLFGRPAYAVEDAYGAGAGSLPGKLRIDIPSYFVANQGQVAEPIAYYARGGVYGAFFTPGEVVLVLQDAEMRVTFPGAAPVRPVGAEPLPTRINDFRGADPAEWYSDLPTYGEVVYPELYPGIDLHYSSAPGTLKYTFVLAPGADAGQISVALEGATGLRVDARGDLYIGLDDRELRDSRPHAYQEVDGRQVEVDVSFSLHSEAGYGFAVTGDYDPRRPLVIDPGLMYSTFLGGLDLEEADALAVDGDGYLYVTGLTRSVGFPSTPGSYNPVHHGGVCGFAPETFPCDDVFVAKMDLSQSGAASLVYCTFLGGSDIDRAKAITVDGSGSVYVKGKTWSIDFPTVNAYQENCAGGCMDFNGDLFVTRLNPAGSALLYSSYLGGNGDEFTYNGIAADEFGRVYVVGYAYLDSTNFPTTPDAWQGSFGGGNYDTVVAWLDTTQVGPASLIYSTYLGGTGDDLGHGIAIDALGAVYVGGYTDSSDFYISPGAFQQALIIAGRKDSFVTKFFPDGSGIAYSTYIGSSSMYDRLRDIAVSADGQACITGDTRDGDPDWPVTPGAFQQQVVDSAEIYVSCFNPAGSDLVYSTLLGGDGVDYADDIFLDAAGRVYVAGYTGSDDFPTRNPYQAGPQGGVDAILAVFNATGSDLIYSTYFGGTDDNLPLDRWDFGQAVAVDADGYVYLSGYSTSEDFPTTPDAYQPIYAGGDYDAFVAKFDVAPDATTVYGYIVDDDGVNMPGVLVRADAAYSVTTDVGGYYSMTLPGGSYTLVPELHGCLFEPASHQVTVPPEPPSQDFVGQCDWDLAGQVLDGAGAPLEGIVVAAGSYSATTDAAGAYTITDVPSGTYTLVPATAGYFWSPLSREVRVPPDTAGLNFAGSNLYKAGEPASWVVVVYSDTITYTLDVVLPASGTIAFYDGIPTHTIYLSGSLNGPAGLGYHLGAGAISGTVTLTAGVPVRVSFAVLASDPISPAYQIANRACLRPVGSGMEACTWSNEVVHYTALWNIYLPLVLTSFGG